jgi:integrase
VRQYYLHVRNRIFYVQFTDPVTQRRLPAISTGKTNRDEAVMAVTVWIREGIPQSKTGQKVREGVSSRSLDDLMSSSQLFATLKRIDLTAQDVLKIEKILKGRGLIEAMVKKGSKEAEPAVDFLRMFWDYDNSPYIAEKHAHGSSIGKTHTRCCLSRINHYWVPYFQGKSLGEATRQNIKDFSVNLAIKYPKLSPTTLRQITLAGVTAFRWAFENEYISTNPTIGLTGYSSKTKKRGVLSPEEVEELFKLEWKNKRSMLINLVAMTTGLRMGEILALKAENIGEEYLTIEHSFSELDGLKLTKTAEDRVVPLIPAIRDAMLNLVRLNPYDNGYVFWGNGKDRPCSPYNPSVSLRKMLLRLRVGENPSSDELKEAKAYWEKRNVVFHSWRHFYAARMTDKLEARKVMLATGHKTEAVFRGYSDHALKNDLSDVAVTTEEVFTTLLPESISEGICGMAAGNMDRSAS